VKKPIDFLKEIKLSIQEKSKSLWLYLKSKSDLFSKRIALRGYNSYVKIANIKYSTTDYLKNSFFRSPLFRICIYVLLAGMSLLGGHLLNKIGFTISAEALSSLADSIGSVIGGSVAIVFTISTFILQNTSELFSTQYLNKFIENKSERRVFFALVLLSVSSFLIPFISSFSGTYQYIFTLLIFSILCSFFLIYVLYIDLRRMINPETTLLKIRNKAIIELRRIKRSFSRSSKLQAFVNSYDEEQKEMLMETQYKLYPAWKDSMVIYVKQLYEISLRLLAKNEIETTKLAIKFIYDIHSEHLRLRSGNFVKMPAGIMSLVYTFDDQNFTSSILEYLESYANRILQENRKENIQHLLQVYEGLIATSLNVEFAKTRMFDRGNPITALMVGYYIGYVENIIATNDINSIWEMVKTTKNVQRIILQKSNDYMLIEYIDSILDKTSMYLLAHPDVKIRTSFITELVQIILNRVMLSWDNYSNDKIFWDRLFKSLKKHLAVSSVILGSSDLSLSNILINFGEWQTNLINSIFDIKDKKVRKEKLDKYISFMTEWSDFLLDYARDFGIDGTPLCLQVIFSVERNTRIINSIENRSKQNQDDLYKTQFNILSWYFHKTVTVTKIHSVELGNLLRFLAFEILINLENKIKLNFTNTIIDLYIRTIDNLFQKAEDTHGFDLPRIIVELVPLGVILNKYKHPYEQKIVDKIAELNDKYILKHKNEWEEEAKQYGKQTQPNDTWVCYEISELKDSVFSYSGVRSDIEEILNKNITEKHWKNFVDKIDCCKGITFTKTRGF
jgi:hypothetical protein